MTKPNTNDLSISFLEYSQDVITQFFKPLSGRSWAMLLQSAAEDHPDNRFDILVADPLATLTSRNGKNVIRYSNGTVEKNSEDPFDTLDRLQGELLPKIDAIDPWPFAGGALGYFSYDLGRQIETLPAIACDDIDIPEMAIGIYDWALIADHKLQTLALIQPQNANRIEWLDAQLKNMDSEQQPFALAGQWQANMTYQQYRSKFDAVQEYLKSGDCYQINLAQRFQSGYQGDEWEAYQRLAKTNGSPFSAFIRIEECSILSVSPERFLQLQGRKIETKPIKGTRPRSKDPLIDKQYIQELSNAEKDRAENLMIVDLLRNDIGRVASPGSVNVPKLFDVESFPAVHHLVSTVTGELDANRHSTDLLRSCFPGGSITGAPKIRAMEIIEELEPHRRSVYCGSIGYISRCGTIDTSITIRTLVCHDQNIYAWAGGGVVADSGVESEYQETLDKLSKILPELAGKHHPE